MGLRQLVRKAARPAAMVAVTAGVLSVSLVAAPPSQALALPPVAPPAIAGAVEGIGGAVVGTALVSNPIGWGVIALTGIGVGLYATKDYWLSYNPGALFLGDNSNTTVNAQGALVDPKVKITGIGPDSNNVSMLDIAVLNGPLDPHQTADQYYHVSIHITCNSKADGTGTAQPDTIVAPYSYYNGGANPPVGANGLLRPTCQYGYPTGAIAGPTHGDDQGLLTADNPGGGPVNIFRWGKYVTPTHSGDPKGATTTYYTTTDCINDQGKIQSLTVNSTGDKGAVKFPSCAAAGLGHSTGAMHVDAFNANDGSTTRVWEMKPPAVDPNEPLCSTMQPGAGCKFQISIDNKPCVIGDLQCENWPTVNANDAAKTRVTCQHGPYTEPLASCNVLEKAYFPGGAPATVANTDGDPTTSNYADPNGTPIPQPAPVQAGTVPGDAGQPAPGMPPAPAGTPAGSSPQDCWPNGWGVLNPLEWVYDPLVCASKALFEPTKDIPTRIGQMQGQFSNKIPITWFTAGTANVSGGACPVNWAFDVAGQHIPVICGTAADGIIRSFRPVMGAMLVLAAIWPLIRSLFYSVIPLLKVNPS